MHMFSKDRNFFGGHGIVGAQVSLGTGLAFSNWYRGNDRVCLTYFGEGASNQGQVYESFNLAALMKLPVVYVIENNRYGMGTSVERASASRDLSRNGAPWGIPGRAGGRHGRGGGEGRGRRRRWRIAAPATVRILLEMMTYRYRGHSMSDPAKYRTREEVQKMRTEHDCIEHAHARLTGLGIDEAEIKAHRRGGEAHRAGRRRLRPGSPEPDAAELWTDVLVEG